MNELTVPRAQTGLIVEIAVESHDSSPSGLSYSVPGPLQGQLRRGQLVWVPLRKQTALGVVLDADRTDDGYDLRSVIAMVEPTFALSESQLAIAAWLARETVSSFYAAAAPFFPPGVSHRAVERYRLTEPDPARWSGVTPAQRRLLALLAERGELTVEAARAAA